MSLGRKDITTLIVLMAAAIICVSYLFKIVNSGQVAAKVDPYGLLMPTPTPTAILAINRPDLLDGQLLSNEEVRRIFEEYVPSVFLSILPELSISLVAYYPRGVLFCSPMEKRLADRVFERLDALSAYPAQRREEAGVAIRYYPDSGNRFLGCYYHKGAFVASYDRKSLSRAIEWQRRDAPVPMELEKAARRGRSAWANLLVPRESLDLSVWLDDSTVWEVEEPWLDLDLFLDGGKLCCFYERGHSFAVADTARRARLYQVVRDSLNARLHRLLPKTKTEARIKSDSAAVYYTIVASD